MMNDRLDHLIMDTFERAPTEPCLWWRGAWWSRGTIGEMAMDCEENLIKSGFKRGHRLGLVLPNSPTMLASSIAAWRLGGSIVPVNPQLKHPALPEYLKSVDVFGAIVSGEVPGLLDLIKSADVPAAQASLNDASPTIEGARVTPDGDSDVAALFHTAGASGDVKAVEITHGNILALLSSILEIIPDLDEDEVILNAIPNHHSLGFVVGGIMPLVGGMPQVVTSSLVPAKGVLAAIRSAGVTIIPAVPMMLSILMGAERSISPMSKVKLVFYGGGDLSPGVAKRVRESFGVEPLEGYGLTEASGVLAVTPPGAPREGTAGRILPCFDAEVRDADGNSLGANESGRLWIKGDAVAKGYYRDPALNAERFRDGWFDTQDIVKIDSDGYITIISTAVDVIMIGGVPVYPAEIEAILKKHPEIEEAAVIGMTRGGKGEYVRACVVLREGSALRPRDIVQYARTKLPNYKAPRSVRIFAELPKDNLGKVLKKELRGA